MRRRSIMAVGLLGLLALAAGACSTQDETGTSISPTTASASADIAATVDIGGGRTMYVECTGSGAPTVVLVSGQRSGGE